MNKNFSLFLLCVLFSSLTIATPEQDGMERISIGSKISFKRNLHIQPSTKYLIFQDGEQTEQWMDGKNGFAPYYQYEVVCYVRVYPSKQDRILQVTDRDLNIDDVKLKEIGSGIYLSGYYTEFYVNSEVVHSIGCSYYNNDKLRPTIKDMMTHFGDFLTVKKAEPVIVRP